MVISLVSLCMSINQFVACLPLTYGQPGINRQQSKWAVFLVCCFFVFWFSKKFEEDCITKMNLLLCSVHPTDHFKSILMVCENLF